MAKLLAPFLLSATALLGGCATEHHGPRAHPALPLAAHTALELRVAQQEVGVVTPTGNAQMYGGGLIGALIDIAVTNKQTKRAESRSASVRDQLAGYSLVDASRKALRDGLAADVFGTDPDVETLSTPLDQDTKAHQLAAKPRVLVIEPHFLFEYDFRALSVALKVTLERRNGDAAPKIEYVNTLFYRVQLDDNADDKRSREERAAAWAALGRDEVIARLERGLAGCVEMLNYDIGAYAEEKAALGPEIVGLHGVVMKHVGDRQWRRYVGGVLASEPEGTR